MVKGCGEEDGQREVLEGPDTEAELMDMAARKRMMKECAWRRQNVYTFVHESDKVGV